LSLGSEQLMSLVWTSEGDTSLYSAVVRSVFAGNRVDCWRVRSCSWLLTLVYCSLTLVLETAVKQVNNEAAARKSLNVEVVFNVLWEQAVELSCRVGDL